MGLDNFLMFIAIANSVVLLALFAIVLKDLKVLKSGLLYISSVVHHIMNVVDCGDAVKDTKPDNKEEVDKLISELVAMMNAVNEVEGKEVKD